jgi:hypothetical protein
MNQVAMKKFNKNHVGIVLVIIGVISRLMPHIPNMTPIISLSLFASMNLSRRMSLLLLLVILFISDLGLSVLFNYPILGYWTLFTYIGFIAISFVGSKLQYSWQSLPVYMFCSSLYFWVWTNFGVWLTSNLYPREWEGLVTCYIAALPFLRNSLIGDMLWGLIIFGIFALIKTTKTETKTNYKKITQFI